VCTGCRARAHHLHSRDGRADQAPARELDRRCLAAAAHAFVTVIANHRGRVREFMNIPGFAALRTRSSDSHAPSVQPPSACRARDCGRTVSRGCWRPSVSTAAIVLRSHLRHIERPTHSRTTRRTNPARRLRPRRRPTTRPRYRDLAQLEDQRAHQTITHRLRPLGLTHLGATRPACRPVRT
jgi:hypothetical protein